MNRNIKTLALDSFTLGSLSKDIFKNSENAKRKIEFLNAVYAHGYVSFITKQHVAELIKQGNNNVVAERLAFFRIITDRGMDKWK